MKFLNFVVENETRLGLLISDGVVDLTKSLAERTDHAFLPAPSSVQDLILFGDEAVKYINEKIVVSNSLSADYKQEEITILAPLRPKKNVFCVGRNYREHIIEGNLARGKPANEFPKAIEFFSKPPTTIVGHEADVHRYKHLTDNLDYEVELAIVIGRKCKDVSKEDAPNYVFGYTIVNDITARNLQQRHGQWFKGKGLDTTCPMGPVVVHHSAIEDPNNLDISLSINGEQRQKDNTSDMIFDVGTIIEQLSTGMTLEPGDVIATGTPKGVGFAMLPPKCLNVGDVISATIEKIGTLTNTIVD